MPVKGQDPVLAAWPQCCICSRPVAPWNAEFCAYHWPALAEPEPYNLWFPSNTMARVAWACLRIALDGIHVYMGKPITPLPGDRPTRVSTSSGNLFTRVKAAVRVEQLAARFTDLKSAGPGKLKGKCPLHEERSASFYIYQDQGRWRCFGACARGGAVIEMARVLMDQGRL